MKKFAFILGLLGIVAFQGGWALPPYPPPSIVAQVTKIIDGDTIEVLLLSVPTDLANALQSGSVLRVRYIGVDAPEPEQPGGKEAKDLNALLVEGRTVYLEVEKTLWDPHGRLLAYVYLDPAGYLMVNLALIATPIIATKTYPDTQRYASLFECVDRCRLLPDSLPLEQPPQPKVIISAVLPNPKGPEPDNEWIELKNIGMTPVDLSGWVLTDDEGFYKIPTGVVLQPGATWRVWGYQYNPTRIRRGLYLANDHDCVRLLNPKGEEVDSCCWTEAREEAVIKCH